jgi:hypothetical protein
MGMAKKKANSQRAVATPKGSQQTAFLRQWFFAHPSLLLALGLIGSLSWGLHRCWRHYAPQVIQSPRYFVPSERITVSSPPEWMNAGIRSEVIQRAGLDHQLSILDKEFVPSLRSAFMLHPWVASVDRITKSYPPAVHLQLSYRRPVAVVEMSGVAGGELLPVNEEGIHLSASHLHDIQKQTLPRISNIVGRPPEGQKWDDPRVAGAAQLATQLAELWQPLYLVDILPSTRPEIRGEHSYFIYSLVTRGGSRIVWGAASQDSPPGEADFSTKIKRLQQCVQRCGALDSVHGPKEINIRNGVVIVPRSARKIEPNSKQQTVLQ